VALVPISAVVWRVGESEQFIIHTDRQGVSILCERRIGAEAGYVRKVLYARLGDDSDAGREEYAATLAKLLAVPAEPISEEAAPLPSG